MVKISILTPSYNYSRFISTAINSTLNDKHNGKIDVEHVIMDGGSNDGTQEILESAMAPGLVWNVEPDKGQSDALNKALHRSSGEIVGWLNADDFYLPGALKDVVKAFETDPTLDVLVGDTLLVDGNGKLIRLFKSYPVPRFVLRFRGTTLMSTSIFIRREVLDDSPFDTRLKRVMDWDLFLSIYRNKKVKVGYCSRPLGAFRFHEDQVTHVASEIVGGLPVEHHLIYKKHRINPRLARLLRPAADFVHKLLKLSRNHLYAEGKSRKLAGLSLIDTNGSISFANFDTILKCCYFKQ